MLPQPDWVGTARMSLNNAADTLRSVGISLRSVADETDWEAPGLKHFHEGVRTVGDELLYAAALIAQQAEEVGVSG